MSEASPSAQCSTSGSTRTLATSNVRSNSAPFTLCTSTRLWAASSAGRKSRAFPRNSLIRANESVVSHVSSLIGPHIRAREAVRACASVTTRRYSTAFHLLIRRCVCVCACGWRSLASRKQRCTVSAGSRTRHGGF